MNWWIIAVLVLVLIILMRFKEVRHKLGLVVISIFILFLVITFAQIYSAHDLELNSFDGVVNAGKIYFSWLGQAVKNVVRVSGYAVKQEWGFNISNISTGK